MLIIDVCAKYHQQCVHLQNTRRRWGGRPIHIVGKWNIPFLVSVLDINLHVLLILLALFFTSSPSPYFRGLQKPVQCLQLLFFRKVCLYLPHLLVNLSSKHFILCWLCCWTISTLCYNKHTRTRDKFTNTILYQYYAVCCLTFFILLYFFQALFLWASTNQTIVHYKTPPQPGASEFVFYP